MSFCGACMRLAQSGKLTQFELCASQSGRWSSAPGLNMSRVQRLLTLNLVYRGDRNLE